MFSLRVIESCNVVKTVIANCDPYELRVINQEFRVQRDDKVESLY